MNKYIYAIPIGITILIISCIPAGILLGFDLLTDFKYHWYAWAALFIAITAFNLWLSIRIGKIEKRIDAMWGGLK